MVATIKSNRSDGSLISSKSEQQGRYTNIKPTAGWTEMPYRGMSMLSHGVTDEEMSITC